MYLRENIGNDPLIIEVGAGEGWFSAFLTNCYPAIKPIFVSTDILSQEQCPNTFQYLSSNDVKTMPNVDANELGKHFKSNSIELIYSVNCYGSKTQASASYGLKRWSGRSQTATPTETTRILSNIKRERRLTQADQKNDYSTQIMELDYRFLQSARTVLKDECIVIMLCRSNICSSFCETLAKWGKEFETETDSNELKASQTRLAAIGSCISRINKQVGGEMVKNSTRLVTTNSFAEISFEELVLLSQHLKFEVTLMPTLPPIDGKFTAHGTKETRNNIAGFNVQIVFQKKPDTWTYKMPHCIIPEDNELNPFWKYLPQYV